MSQKTILKTIAIMVLLAASFALFADGRLAHEVYYPEPSSYILSPDTVSWKYTQTDPGSNWNGTSFNDSSWSTKQGIIDGTVWASGNDDIWLRTTFTAGQSDADTLGVWASWDDSFTVYINGQLAASREQWSGNNFIYTGITDAAKSSITSGSNTLAVHVKDIGGNKYIDLGLAANPYANLPATGYEINPQLSVISDYFKTWMEEYGIPAAAVAVTQNGNLVYSKGFGHMDKQQTITVKQDAVFRHASIDKVITGDAIRLLYSRGTLSPGMNVFNLLAGYGIHPAPALLDPATGDVVDDRVKDITIQHLLDFKAGLPEMPGSWNIDEFYDAFIEPGQTVSPVNADNMNIHHNARWLIGQSLVPPDGVSDEEFYPGGFDTKYTSSHYMLLRYIIHLVTGDLEDFLQTDMFAAFAPNDIFIARERLEDRAKYSDGTLREPWYVTGETPYPRWLHLDNYTALASSAEGYSKYLQNYPGAGKFYGGMAGTQTIMTKWGPGNYVILFNATGVPTRDLEKGINGIDGDFEDLINSLDASAWEEPAAHCSSTIQISPDFTQDGVGEFCFEAVSLGTYINSWNLDLLEINGVDYTNQYTSTSSLPAPVNGKYIVHYESSVPWGHFEAKN